MKTVLLAVAIALTLAGGGVVSWKPRAEKPVRVIGDAPGILDLGALFDAFGRVDVAPLVPARTIDWRPSLQFA